MKTKFIIILLFIITTLVVHAQSDDTRYKWNGRDSLGCLTTLNPNDNVSEYYYVEVIDTTLFFRDFLETFAQKLNEARPYTNIPIIEDNGHVYRLYIFRDNKAPIGLKHDYSYGFDSGIFSDFVNFVCKHYDTDLNSLASSLRINAKELNDYYRIIERYVGYYPSTHSNEHSISGVPFNYVFTRKILNRYKKASMLIPIYQKIIDNYLETSNAYLSDKNGSSETYDTLLDSILLYFPNLASSVETIISKHEKPMKVLSFPNPYYKPIEKQWAWLDDNDKWEHIVEHYPKEIDYYKHVDHPEYQVYGEIAYKNGRLVAVSKSFFRIEKAGEDSFLDEKVPLYYLCLFKNNKYNVDREPIYVRDAIIEEIFDIYFHCYPQNGKHKDETKERAKNYIKQLQKDYPRNNITIKRERVDGLTMRIYLYYDNELQFVLLQKVQEGMHNYITPFAKLLPRLLQFEFPQKQGEGLYYTLELESMSK